jgi:photosystem II stability/assembly factor-like uncharacterized protein
MDYTIGVGTVGWGLWLSYDSGSTWRHMQKVLGAEGTVRALAVSPHASGHLLASSDGEGLFRSVDGGFHWEPAGGPTDRDIWSLAFDPRDDQRLYVGTRPGLFRSADGGTSYEDVSSSFPAQCMIGVPRTTNVVPDPARPERVWATVEIGGLHRSDDRGATWEDMGALGGSELHQDVHGFAVRGDGGGGELLLTTPFGLARSRDDGASWAWHEFDPFPGARFEFAYSRCVRAPWGDGTVLVCVGDGIPGSAGALEVSRDGGQTWKRADLPVAPNSTMYWLATHDDLPGVVVATSVFGQAFVSDDHAETWRKLDRELGHVRAVCVLPR